MDNLDRLYVELVEALRRERPEALDQPLSVAEIHERLVPYRRVRDLVGFRSNDDYEATLSCLLAGDRDYILGEVELRSRLRSALEEPLPDIRRFRMFRDARVRLNPEKIPPPGDFRYAPPEVREQATRPSPTTAHDSEPEDEPEDAVNAPAEDGDSIAAQAETAPAQPTPAEFSENVAVEPAARSGAGSDQEPPASAEPAAANDPASGMSPCPDCGSRPPEGAVFCPYCGRRLGAAACRECGSDLEADWTFCATCGAAVRGDGNPA